MKRVPVALAITLALGTEATAAESPANVLCCGAKYAITFADASPDDAQAAMDQAMIFGLAFSLPAAAALMARRRARTRAA